MSFPLDGADNLGNRGELPVIADNQNGALSNRLVRICNHLAQGIAAGIEGAQNGVIRPRGSVREQAPADQAEGGRAPAEMTELTRQRKCLTADTMAESLWLWAANGAFSPEERDQRLAALVKEARPYGWVPKTADEYERIVNKIMEEIRALPSDEAGDDIENSQEFIEETMQPNRHLDNRTSPGDWDAISEEGEITSDDSDNDIENAELDDRSVHQVTYSAPPGDLDAIEEEGEISSGDDSDDDEIEIDQSEEAEAARQLQEQQAEAARQRQRCIDVFLGEIHFPFEDERRENFEEFLNKLLQGAGRPTQIIDDVAVVAQMLVALETKEVYPGEKEQAWKEVEDGGTACGDRATIHLQRLMEMSLLRCATDLQTAELIIIGSHRSQLIHQYVAADFSGYHENLEVALMAQRELHTTLLLPGKRPEMLHADWAVRAFAGRQETQREYLDSLRAQIEAATDRKDQQLKILSDSPQWVGRIKAMNAQAFKERADAARSQEEALEQEKEAQAGTDKPLPDGEYNRRYSEIGAFSEGKDLVDAFTRRYLRMPPRQA